MFDASESVSTRSTKKHSIVDYTFEMHRFSFSDIMLWVLPCVLFNSIGFIAFWIDNPGESIALGITTLLCTVALRESIGLPKEAAFSWGGMFLALNCTYQCIVVGFVFLEYCEEKIEFGKNCCRRAREPAEVIDVMDLDTGVISRTSVTPIAVAAAASEDSKTSKLDFDLLGRWIVAPSYYLLAAYMFWKGGDLL